MRHRKAGKKLNRDIKHRKSLFKNLINALIIHEEIKTTESKAKAIKGIVDKLIARGKKGTLHTRRIISAFLQNKKAVNKVVDELGPRFKDRVSGFTRIIKLGARQGDNAMMAKIELTEKVEVAEKKTSESKKQAKEKDKKPQNKNQEKQKSTKKNKKDK